MRNFKILMHTHWDREWYFTIDETKVYLRNHMYDVFDFLDENPDVIYVLDGQSVLIDDFKELSKRDMQRFSEYMQSGQLLVGPWYTQTDLLIVHGEMIINNLKYGIDLAAEYTNPMLNGYAPDTFGHNDQMPQIYKMFGIDNTIFWRGFSELKAKKSDFIWRGIDGSEVYGINLATGYQGAKYLESDKEELSKRLSKIVNVLDEYSASDARLIMNGHDQMPIQKDIKEVIKNMKELYPEDNIKIASFDDYIDEVKKHELEVVSGELVDSKHARIHRSINSTRMDIKLLNATLEYKFIDLLIPLVTRASYEGLEYPDKLIEEIFKKFFSLHAHDSIGGCNGDMVNQDIIFRLNSISELINAQIEVTSRLLTLNEQAKDNKSNLVVFNPLPYKRNDCYVKLEVITGYECFNITYNDMDVDFSIISQEKIYAGLIDRQIAARLVEQDAYISQVIVKIPEIGSLELLKMTVKESAKCEKNNIEESNFIENELYKITISDNRINVLDKSLNKEFSELLVLEYSPDDGDSYDYSPPVKDFKITDNLISVEKVLKGNFNSEIELKIMLNIPLSQDNWYNENMYETQEFFVKLGLVKDSELISCNFDVDNKIKDGRIRLLFNQEIYSEEVIVDMQLSEITKDTYNLAPLNIWEEDKWAEKPVSIETMQSYLNLKNSENDFNVITNGLKEYEIVDKKYIAITLYRTFAQLGKSNLVNRPGRPSGIEIATPDNQLQKKLSSNLVFSTHKLSKSRAIVAKEWLSSLYGYHLKDFNKFNINTRDLKMYNYDVYESINKLSLENLVVSSVFMENNKLNIRLYNTNTDTIKLENLDNVYLKDLSNKKEVKIDELIFKENEIKTIVLK